jgi:hypothetical protein
LIHIEGVFGSPTWTGVAKQAGDIQSAEEFAVICGCQAARERLGKMATGGIAGERQGQRNADLNERCIARLGYDVSKKRADSDKKYTAAETPAFFRDMGRKLSGTAKSLKGCFIES